MTDEKLDWEIDEDCASLALNGGLAVLSVWRPIPEAAWIWEYGEDRNVYACGSCVPSMTIEEAKACAVTGLREHLKKILGELGENETELMDGWWWCATEGCTNKHRKYDGAICFGCETRAWEKDRRRGR